MGYDMTTVVVDEGEQQRVDELSARARAASGAERDELYRQMQAAHRSYFRLNIWGMGIARRVMDAAGMLDLDRPAAATWPSENQYDVTSDMWEGWDGEPDENTPEPLRRFLDACEAVASYAKPEPVGIPAYKLGTNDDWLVTPAEIRAALTALDGKTPPDAPEWWGEWVGWLRYAQAHDGFRVL